MARQVSKSREGLDTFAAQAQISLYSITQGMPKPRTHEQIIGKIFPSLFYMMKFSLVIHPTAVIQHPSLSVNNVKTFGISEYEAFAFLDVPPRMFVLLCWYGGENYSRLPCRIFNNYKRKNFVSCPLHTDKHLWYMAYKRLNLDKLVELFMYELKGAYFGGHYSVLTLKHELVKNYIMRVEPVVKPRTRRRK